MMVPYDLVAAAKAAALPTPIVITFDFFFGWVYLQRDLVGVAVGLCDRKV